MQAKVYRNNVSTKLSFLFSKYQISFVFENRFHPEFREQNHAEKWRRQFFNHLVRELFLVNFPKV